MIIQTNDALHKQQSFDMSKQKSQQHKNIFSIHITWFGNKPLLCFRIFLIDCEDKYIPTRIAT